MEYAIEYVGLYHRSSSCKKLINVALDHAQVYKTGEGNACAMDYAGSELGIILCVDLCQIFVQTCVLLLVHSVDICFSLSSTKGRWLYMADSGHE